MPTETLDASPVPSESTEQTRLFQWARMQQGRWPELRLLYHIPNGGSRHRLEAIHMKQQGVRAGVPDLCLPVARAGCHGLYVEMKRLKGGRVSPEQLAWMEVINLMFLKDIHHPDLFDALKSTAPQNVICQLMGIRYLTIKGYCRFAGISQSSYEYMQCKFELEERVIGIPQNMNWLSGVP